MHKSALYLFVLYNTEILNLNRAKFKRYQLHYIYIHFLNYVISLSALSLSEKQNKNCSKYHYNVPDKKKSTEISNSDLNLRSHLEIQPLSLIVIHHPNHNYSSYIRKCYRCFQTAENFTQIFRSYSTEHVLP